jgi:hypothetical protein
MNIVPAPVENYTKRIPRNIALWQGIAGIVIALWSVVMLSVVLYAASPFSIVEVPTGTLILSFVKWVAGIAFGAFLAVAFLQRYAKHP